MAVGRRTLLAFVLMFAPGLALAQTPAPAPVAAPAPEPEAASLAAWGEAHAACGEWSDLCQVCIRVGQENRQEIHCSTPGIACTPQAPVCRAPVAPPATK